MLARRERARPLRAASPPARPRRAWFIPDAIEAQGREAVIRSQAILVAVAAALVTGPITAALDARMGRPQWPRGARVLGARGRHPFVLRRTGSLALAGNLTVAVVFFDLMVPGLLTLGGAAVAFFFMIPLFAVVLCGRRAAITWTALAAACTLSSERSPRAHSSRCVALPAGSPARLYRIGLVALVVSGACILTYDLIKDAALSVERANRALRESREQFRQLIEAYARRGLRDARAANPLASARGRDLLGAACDAELLGRDGANSWSPRRSASPPTIVAPTSTSAPRACASPCAASTASCVPVEASGAPTVSTAALDARDPARPPSRRSGTSRGSGCSARSSSSRTRT